MKLKHSTLLALVVTTGLGHAAVVTWDASASSTSPVTSTTDILNQGIAATDITFTKDNWPSGTSSFLAANGALNFGENGGIVNGVSFSGSDGSGSYWTGQGRPSTGDATLDDILNTHAAFGNDSDPWKLAISGLLPNTEYMIQIIGIHDARGSGISDRTTSFQDQDGGFASATLTRGNGGWVTGTFTTGAAETSFTIDALGSTDPGASAVVLRVIPEPSAAALLGLGGLVLALRRRK